MTQESKSSTFLLSILILALPVTGGFVYCSACKIELINAKKLSYPSFPTFNSSDGNNVPGISDIVDAVLKATVRRPMNDPGIAC